MAAATMIATSASVSTGAAPLLSPPPTWENATTIDALVQEERAHELALEMLRLRREELTRQLGLQTGTGTRTGTRTGGEAGDGAEALATTTTQDVEDDADGTIAPWVDGGARGGLHLKQVLDMGSERRDSGPFLHGSDEVHGSLWGVGGFIGDEDLNSEDYGNSTEASAYASNPGLIRCDLCGLFARSLFSHPLWSTYCRCGISISVSGDLSQQHEGYDSQFSASNLNTTYNATELWPHFKVKAIEDYTNSHDNALNFSIDDIITVTAIENERWYFGHYEDQASGCLKQGIFPKGFVELVSAKTTLHSNSSYQLYKNLFATPGLLQREFEDRSPGDQLADPLERYLSSSSEGEGSSLADIQKAARRTPPPRWSRSSSPRISQSNAESSTSSCGGSAHSSANSAHSHSSLLGRRKTTLRYQRRKNVQPRNPDKVLYQCTFCSADFLRHGDWKRHEEGVHLVLNKWICSYHEYSESRHETTTEDTCLKKPLDTRTFSRKEHLKQHLKHVHHQGWHEEYNVWCQKIEPPRKSRCGFCGDFFLSWAKRMEHIGAHYKERATMSTWEGDWGFGQEWMAEGRLQGATRQLSSPHSNSQPKLSQSPDSGSTNPYNILGISVDATVPTIRSTYKKLMFQCHPDRIHDDAKRVKASVQFERVQKAYEILIDPRVRRRYDEQLKIRGCY